MFVEAPDIIDMVQCLRELAVVFSAPAASMPKVARVLHVCCHCAVWNSRRLSRDSCVLFFSLVVVLMCVL